MSDVLSVLRIRWQESREFFSFSMETWATLKALRKHLHSYSRHSHKFYWKDLSVRCNWLWNFWSPANFCARKVKRVKFHKCGTWITLATASLFVESLPKVNFLNYEGFSNIDGANNDFLITTIKTGFIEKLLILFMFGKNCF